METFKKNKNVIPVGLFITQFWSFKVEDTIHVGNLFILLTKFFEFEK
jgi:hypothetical protein